jgi:lipid A ethanolaminephosphotransferase
MVPRSLDSLRSYARGWHVSRIELSVEALILWVLVLLLTLANGPLWRVVAGAWTLGEPSTWRAVGAILVVMIAAHFLAIALLATRHTVRPLLATLIVASALGAHFMQRYGVVLDPSMIRSALQTDVRETAELMGTDTLIALLSGLLAAGLLWTLRLRRRTPMRAVLVRVSSLGAALMVGLVALFACYQDLASLVRNDHHLRYTVTPGNILWSVGQVVANELRLASAPGVPIEPAMRRISVGGQRKPTLLVLVIGEAARSASFSLNGYARQTNPQLAQIDIINFPRTVACGTNTAVSLPCMFSPFGRADYDRNQIRRHESLLHLLARAGMRVVWLDNQSGCKGVCDGLEFRDLSREQIPGICADSRCYDEVLLHDMERIVEDFASDLVVVLHQLGNHGPAYYRRYPPELRRFEPACEHNEFGGCTRDQIVNAYDNAIAYTDRFLASTIRFLEQQGTRFDVALVYVSDHGESLGELGLYLHGLPYAIAPREQLEVPMLWWLPAEAARNLGVDVDCFRRRTAQPVSHDNLFHSLLGLLAVETPRYLSARDLFHGCGRRNRAADSRIVPPAGHGP